jgi:hypothetical protein
MRSESVVDTDKAPFSLDDGHRMLDEAARQHLNMSGDEFIAAWDEDRFTDPDSVRVQQVAALLPFGQ